MKNNVYYVLNMYKLRDWIDKDKLTNRLSCNVNAVDFLENNMHLVDAYYIYFNINAITILEKKIGCDNYSLINYNEEMITFLRNNTKFINYYVLCYNCKAIDFVNNVLDDNKWYLLNWTALSRNPAAIDILNNPKYYDKINWNEIIENPNACELLKKNIDKIDNLWITISSKPYLIDLIENNLSKIDWSMLSRNCNAIHILENHMDKINIHYLYHNANGFELLLKLHHVFDPERNYHKNIILQYFDYCLKNDIPFNHLDGITEHGYSEIHFNYLYKNKHVLNYNILSLNPNIFIYDYVGMRKKRQSLSWYNDLINMCNASL
jgi:hypothetical protein